MRHNGKLLLISAAGLFFGAQAPSLAAQSVSSVTLAGTVIDQQGKPIPEVQLSLLHGSSIIDVTQSNASGRFEFREVTPAALAVIAQRIGYRQRTIQVNVGNTTAQQSVEIDLVAIPVDLEAVVVEDSKGRIAEFNEHRKASKFGKFYDQNEIRKKSPRYLSELFRSVPGARLSPNPSGGSYLLLRGCKPKIWIDGVLAQYAEIDDIISPSEIAGIEIYSSMAGVPAQYMDRENRACGSVIIWSRQA